MGEVGAVTWVYERVPGHQLALLPDNIHVSSPSTASVTPVDDSAAGNWPPGPESSSLFPEADAASFPSNSQSSPSDYTTARNSVASSSSSVKQGSGDDASSSLSSIMQQEIELAKLQRNKKTKKKTATRLSSGLGSARSSFRADQRVQEIHASSLLRCAEACLQQSSFPCLSANFERVRDPFLLCLSLPSFHSFGLLSSCPERLRSFLFFAADLLGNPLILTSFSAGTERRQ